SRLSGDGQPGHHQGLRHHHPGRHGQLPGRDRRRADHRHGRELRRLLFLDRLQGHHRLRAAGRDPVTPAAGPLHGKGGALMTWLQGKTGWALLAVAALVFPLFAQNNYLISVATQAFIMAIAALGLNLITGYTGQFNLAHGAFMAVGAYTVGILTVDHQVPFWIAFVLAGVVTGVLGYFIGLLSLRLRGHYFSIFTLCVSYI